MPGWRGRLIGLTRVMAQADKAAKAKRLEDATNLSKAWSQRLEDEAQAKKGATKEDREKLKKAQSKARNTFRKLLRATATLSLGDIPKAGGEYGFLADKDVELICANADVSDINDMIEAMGGDKAAKDSAIQKGSATEKRGKPFWTIRAPKTPALPF